MMGSGNHGVNSLRTWIKDWEQKELLRLVLHKAILGPDYVKMALYGRPPEIGPLATAEPRSETLNWLLGQVSQSVLLLHSVGIKATPGLRGRYAMAVTLQTDPR